MSVLDRIYGERREHQGLRFDPRTKLALLVLLDIAVFLGRSLPYECAVFLTCALLVAVGGMAGVSFRSCVAFALLVALQHVIGPVMGQSSALSLAQFLAVAVRKVLPCVLVAYWVVETTGVGEFSAALWKSKVPRNAIVTTSVIFRCFPTIGEEWRAIRSAMKMRGIGTGPSAWIVHPIRTLVCLYVPLFASVATISDELAAAALCRGLDDPGPHTSLSEIGFHAQDRIVLALVAAGVLVVTALALAGKGF